MSGLTVEEEEEVAGAAEGGAQGAAAGCGGVERYASKADARRAKKAKKKEG